MAFFLMQPYPQHRQMHKFDGTVSHAIMYPWQSKHDGLISFPQFSQISNSATKIPVFDTSGYPISQYARPRDPAKSHHV